MPTPRTPSKLRLINGARPDKVNQNEPVPTDKLPVCPDAEPTDVRAVFERTVRWLDQMGLASAADTDALLIYCWAVVVHQNARDELAGDQLLKENAFGNSTPNPLLKVMQDAAVTAHRYATQFGLTPSARAGIEVKGPDAGDNPFAQPG